MKIFLKYYRDWIELVFPKYHKEMKDIYFGVLYNRFKNKEYDSKKLEEEITKINAR